MNYLFHTERLSLRKFSLRDASFILKLLNTEGWIKFIGNKYVRNEKDAEAYIQETLEPLYRHLGFYAVEVKDEKTLIGMCGIMKRKWLENSELGFAFLPEYEGKGYAYEAANAMLEYWECNRFAHPLCAITTPDNERSIKLLEKISFRFYKEIQEPETGEALFLFQKIG